MPAPTIAYLEGTWPDGTVPGYAPSRVALAMPERTDGVVHLTVYTGAGGAKNISGYAVALCTTFSTFAASTISAASGTCSFALTQTDTDITPGRYKCQIEATAPDGIREMLTAVGTFDVLPVVGA